MKKKERKIRLDFLVPVIVFAVTAVIGLPGIFETPDNRIYDLFLHLKPALPENKSLLLLDVDDLAIAKVGVWPWSRHIMGDGLVTMKEFGADYAVFDIEYTEDSPQGVNTSVLKEKIPELFNQEFSNITENTDQLFHAVQTGMLPLQAIPDYVADLKNMNETAKKTLLNSVQEIARDNDEYLGRAARYFGNAYFTVNLLPETDEDVPAERKEWAKDHVSLANVEGPKGAITEEKDLRPTIDKVIKRAAGAGFTNIIIDKDGVRRRLDLLVRVGDHIFGQLAFRPLLHWLGDPKIIVSRTRIILQDAKIPDGPVKNIVIPRTPDGKVLINWPKKQFEESFRHLSFYYLVLHAEQEDRLVHNLKTMNDAGYLSFYQGDTGLMDLYNHAQQLKDNMLQSGNLENIQEYRDVRTYFFKELGQYLSGPARDEITAQLDAALATPGLSEKDAADYRQIKDDVKTFFSAASELYANLKQTRDVLAKELTGAFCIIGWTGTSTTDRGVNPFSKEYDNVGTHASIVNTILSGKFLQTAPWWVALAASLVLALAVFFSIRKLTPGASIGVGVGYIIVLFGGSICIFAFGRLYIPMMQPLISVAGTFLVLTVIQFLSTAKEKSFIRNAFGRYLSGNVVDELIKHPEKLSLGGEKRTMTAFFTDVQGFSTISEVLDPTDLVSLLNMYLTRMSDILLADHATIDKYEGDAIMAFFGAPIDLPDHAALACRSAIRIKEAERELNRHIRENSMSQSPLLTRIGINTGEMVVGNMGTADKMDYTVMGNAVNLAARLEGVNKQYGTWILMSESTYLAGGNTFVTRKLDRVRVVGIRQPVRLYELIGEKETASQETLKALDRFHEGLDLFEAKKWKDAGRAFNDVLKTIPEDGPSERFLKRCKEFEKEPPKDGWDGVFTLSMK